MRNSLDNGLVGRLLTWEPGEREGFKGGGGGVAPSTISLSKLGVFAIAEIELQHTRERQAAGIATAKEKGVYMGRKKGSLKAKPERARALKEKGLTAKEIANALNVSERSAFRYLAS